MDDKERIEFLIGQLGMTNVEFAAKTGIAPATLSHITSGRSKPTLTILRGIIAGFPDLNPEWILMGTGTMYKETTKQQIENSDINGSADDGTDMFSFDTVSTDHSNADQSRPVTRGPRMEDVVKATVAAMATGIQKQHKVVEIRIFFDDGTYQEFK